MTVTNATAVEQHEDVLASRPRVRRDILYTQVPDGVLFHDAKTGFRIHGRTAYKFSTLVVPHLDGSRTVAELCAGIGDAQRAMVVDLVSTLYSRGYARAVPAPDPQRAQLLTDDVRRHFAAQIAYVDHHVDEAEERFSRWRETKVAVLGEDDVARWAALSLLRNGVATIGVLDSLRQRHEDVADEADELRADGCDVELRELGDPGAGWSQLGEYDVVVVTPGTHRTRDLLALAEAGVPDGHTLLPVWQIGGQAVIGPLMRSGTTGCWVCAALRLGANGGADGAAELWADAAGVGSRTQPPSGPLAAMVGNLLGYEIFRLTTGALPGETDGQVIVQDMDSLDVAVEPLRPHPDCPHCVTDATTPVSTTAARPVPDQRMPEPGNPESERRLATLAERAALVGRHVGTFRRFDDDRLTQTPLRVSTVELALGPGRVRRIVAFDIHNVAGARLAALTAAARVYADHMLVPPVHTAAPGERRVASDELVTTTGLSAAGPGDRSVSAISLHTGQPVLVPAAAAAPRSAHNGRRTFRTGGGLGVDATPEQARGDALLAALGDDALRAAMHGEVPVLSVRAPWHADDPVLTFLARTAATLGVEVDLLELGSADAQPAPVLLARTTVGDAVLWTAATDTSWRAAAVTVLRDLLGRVQLGDALPGGDAVDTGDAWIDDLAAQTLVPSDDVSARHDLERRLPEILGRLEANGTEALAIDVPAADLVVGGLSVARVLLRRRRDAD
jgi:bacteriocin biosynthesis cyclodehydratase domain-containing protein